MMGKKEKRFAFPETIALLFFLICVAAILTVILPAGEYDTVKVGKMTRVVAGTYHAVAQSPQGPFAVLNAVVTGFQRASVLFAMVLFTGSAVHMMQKSGAVEVAFRSLSAKGGARNLSKIVFVIMAFMSIGGATGVFANPTVALIPIGMILSKTMGLDAAAGFIIAFANGISVILKDGHILNTIVYYLSIPIGSFGPVIGAILMFWANLFINLFIPSGSGQASAVMPLMVPLADLTGITRQVAVQAFQFGDGLSNCIVPTAGTIMGSLGIAGVAYNRYAKWFAPFLLLQSILASIALAILQMAGWTGL